MRDIVPAAVCCVMTLVLGMVFGMFFGGHLVAESCIDKGYFEVKSERYECQKLQKVYVKVAA